MRNKKTITFILILSLIFGNQLSLLSENVFADEEDTVGSNSHSESTEHTEKTEIIEKSSTEESTHFEDYTDSEIEDVNEKVNTSKETVTPFEEKSRDEFTETNSNLEEVGTEVIVDEFGRTILRTTYKETTTKKIVKHIDLNRVRTKEELTAEAYTPENNEIKNPDSFFKYNMSLAEATRILTDKLYLEGTNATMLHEKKYNQALTLLAIHNREIEKKMIEDIRKEIDVRYFYKDVLIPKMLVCDVGSGPDKVYSYTKNVGGETIKGIQSIYVTLTPVKPANFSKLSPVQQKYWNNTHKSQKIGPILTPYGKFLQKNHDKIEGIGNLDKGGHSEDSSYRLSWEDFSKKANRAINKGIPNLEIKLNDKNLKGLIRGGVYTFTEFAKDASVRTVHKQDYATHYRCRREKHWYHSTKHGGHWHYHTVRRVSSTGNIFKGQYADNPTTIVEGSNYYPNRSYQIINVRCNKQGFDELVSSTGSKVISKTSKKGVATAKSPTVNKSISNVFNKAATIEFLYEGKDCDDIFGCTSNKNVGAKNDSSNNLQDEKYVTNDKFGAQSTDRNNEYNYNSSEFKFFRDNVPHIIRNDVWYLANKNTVSEMEHDSRTSANNTLLTLFKDATPTDDLFQLLDKEKTVILTGKKLLSDDNALVFKGQENKFYWQASWASEKEKPHKINIKYAYKPKTVYNTPNTFNQSGPINFIMTKEVLDMICDVNFNSKDMETPHIKNQPKEEKYKKIKEFNDDKKKSLQVEFIKTTAE